MRSERGNASYSMNDEALVFRYLSAFRLAREQSFNANSILFEVLNETKKKLTVSVASLEQPYSITWQIRNCFKERDVDSLHTVDNNSPDILPLKEPDNYLSSSVWQSFPPIQRPLKFTPILP